MSKSKEETMNAEIDDLFQPLIDYLELHRETMKRCGGCEFTEDRKLSFHFLRFAMVSLPKDTLGGDIDAIAVMVGAEALCIMEKMIAFSSPIEGEETVQ